MANPKLGFQGVLEMFRLLDDEHRSRLLSEIQERDPQLALKLQNELIDFQELLDLNPADQRVLFQAVPQTLLSMAIKGLSEEKMEKVFSQIPKRKKQELLDEMELLGKRKLSDVEAARRKVTQIAEGLMKEGKIERCSSR